MHIDALKDIEKELDRQDRIEGRALAAQEFAEHEFELALMLGPREVVSDIVGRRTQQTTVVQAVAEILNEEDDHYTLAGLITCMTAQARMGDLFAEGLIRGLCAVYADRQVQALAEVGEFNDDQ